MTFQVILAFPTNQFGHQENSDGEEILNSLKYVRPGNGFVPKCIMMDKVKTHFTFTD
jgi:glutathione peroxidase